jgi:hypothetical protein
VEKRKKGEEKEAAARATRVPELEKTPPSSSRSRAAWHYTASRLHGHNPPLHHHPITNATTVSNPATLFLLAVMLAPCPPLRSFLEKRAKAIAFAFSGSRTRTRTHAGHTLALPSP